jgi:hypothetical protein
MPRPIASDTWLPGQHVCYALPTARTHCLRSEFTEGRGDPVPFDEIQHDHLRNFAARPAFEGHRQSEFKYATQRVPIPILLAEYEFSALSPYPPRNPMTKLLATTSFAV